VNFRTGTDRRKPVTETQMVSLADIAFLIIFFFMLTSNFMKDRSTIALPTLPEATRTESDTTVSVDDHGAITLDGDPVGSPAELEGLLKDKLTGKKTDKECEIRFKCDRAQTYTTYHPIYQAIANAGGVIAVMHEVRK
jgi:biopolymer transport protein ExbD